MQIYKTLAIAVALAMDALAVAMATGVSLRTVSFRQTFRLSWHFGFFQAMMPVIGWAAGLTVRSHIERYDHWVAFGLLAFVGGNMIRESFRGDKEHCRRRDPTKGLTLVMLSTATSIDALAVGLSMSMLKVSIWIPALIIGLVAILFTGIGLHVGRKAGCSSRLSEYAEALGGIVLLAIGLNILREHGVLVF